MTFNDLGVWRVPHLRITKAGRAAHFRHCRLVSIIAISHERRIRYAVSVAISVILRALKAPPGLILAALLVD
jgi:hypothetical protein